MKRTTTQKPITEGGKNIFDLKTKSTAQKLTTIKILFDHKTETPQKTLMTYYLDKFRNAGQGPWTMLTFLNDPNRSSLPDFYKELITGWRTMTLNRRPRPTTIEAIFNEPIYYNPFMPHKPTRQNPFPKLPTPDTNTETITIGDICKQFVPGYMSHTALDMTEDDLRKITSRIPPDWNRLIQTTPQAYNPQLYSPTIYLTGDKETNIQKLTSKQAYLTIHENNHPTEKTYRNWERKTGHLGDKTWRTIFTQIQKNHRNRLASDIKYQIIHHTLPTRSYLHTKNPQIPPTCPRCQWPDEDFDHWLFECPLSQRAREKVVKILHTYYRKQYRNFARLIILGDDTIDFDMGQIVIDAYITTIYETRMTAIKTGQNIEPTNYMKTQIYNTTVSERLTTNNDDYRETLRIFGTLVVTL